MVIWKWKLPRQNKFALSMPGGKDADVLYVASDGEDGFLWARVNPNSERRSRDFERHLTGMTSLGLTDTAKYIGSYRENDGFVAHIFEKQS